MNGHYHRSKKGGGEWEFFDLPEQWHHSLQRSYFQPKTVQLQTHRTFPGTGNQLGLVR